MSSTNFTFYEQVILLNSLNFVTRKYAPVCIFPLPFFYLCVCVQLSILIIMLFVCVCVCVAIDFDNNSECLICRLFSQRIHLLRHVPSQRMSQLVGVQKSWVEIVHSYCMFPCASIYSLPFLHVLQPSIEAKSFYCQLFTCFPICVIISLVVKAKKN